MFVSDLLDRHNALDKVCIYNKLTCKRNWMSECSILFQTLPEEWTEILKQEVSRLTQVKINNFFWILSAKYLCFDAEFNVNSLYNMLVDVKFEKPHIQGFWNKYF